ncbi:cytidylyltransferase domain-containing protein [Phenylobacterium sp.]|uniref:cytidylyltransferase domain-containing protein n=1 Tax=Phenylobacterium sp. TaxID=1871053 RepID=UPI0028A162D7|nr:NTP transferase domain-containing protein [Phenylobacterium sp.]
MILAVLQARMTSARLPGKAMAPLRGEPMVWRQVERIRAARTVSRLIVATSVEPVDDPLATYLLSRGQSVLRGAASNLAERFLRTVEAASAPTHLVRIKGDCPFVDPAIIDDIVRLALSTGAAYASNRVERTYPKGLEVEVASVAALNASIALADPQSAGTRSPLAQIRARPDLFAQAHHHAPRDLSRLDWRVKTPADFAFARAVYDALHAADPAFAMQDVLDITQGRQDLARWAA